MTGKFQREIFRDLLFVKNSSSSSRHTPRACKSGLICRNGCLASSMSEGRYVVTISTRIASNLPARKLIRSTVETSAQCRSSKKITGGSAERLAEVRKLALHLLLRRTFDFSQQPRRLFSHLNAAQPARTTSAQAASSSAQCSRCFASQAFQRFKQRQVGFGSCQSFRATPACNCAFARPRKLSEKILDERGLADPWFTRDTHQGTAPGLRCIECRSQCVAFRITSHSVTERTRDR